LIKLPLNALTRVYRYSELRNKNPAIGSDISTLVTGLQTLGALLALSFAGVLSDRQLFATAFAICIGLAAAHVVPTLLGWMPETKIPHTVLSANVTMLRQQWRIAGAVVFCGFCSMASSAIVTLASPLAGLVTALVLVAACLAGCWVAFSRTIFRIAVYQVTMGPKRSAAGGGGGGRGPEFSCASRADTCP
jgi:hypothetical protein